MTTTRTFLLLASLAFCAGAAARDVYKCTRADGSVAFQDKPCAKDATESTVRVTDAMGTPPVAAAEPEPIPEVTMPVPPAPAPKPVKPLPPLWLCENAEDGSRYVSRYGAPPPRRVPLGVLGYGSKSLAETYAAGNNVMSAPEFNKPPIDNSARGSVAAGYTEVQDQCLRLSPDQTCNVLHQELDQLGDKLRRARFKSERSELQTKVDELEGDLGGC